MSAPPISITTLNQVEDEVNKFIIKIKDAFLRRSPRMEMEIYMNAMSLLDTHTPPSAEDKWPFPESKIVISHHLQVIFAALIFLVDEEKDPVEGFKIDLKQRPTEPCDRNLSPFFVSSAQRKRAFYYMLWLIWRVPLRTKVIIGNLLPLLDRAGDNLRPTASSNTMSTKEVVNDEKLNVNLFEDEHFRPKTFVVSCLLNGILLFNLKGVEATLSVLLLNDRVPAQDLFPACQHIVKLLLHPMKAATVFDKDKGIVEIAAVSIEDQVRYLCKQLLPLLEASSHDFDVPNEVDMPNYLKKLSKIDKKLPEETLGERLHVCLTLICNGFLPKFGAQVTKSQIQLFSLANKFLFSPAFLPLSLRKSGISEDSVLRTLKRLHCLVHGVSLGAPPPAFLRVWEVVGGGFLSVVGLTANLPLELSVVSDKIVEKILAFDVGVDPITWTLVHSCTKVYKCRFVIPNIVERTLKCEDGEGSKVCRINGVRLFLNRSSGVFYWSLISALSEKYHAIDAEETEPFVDDDTEIRGETKGVKEYLQDLVQKFLLEKDEAKMFATDVSLVSLVKSLTLLCPISPVILQFVSKLTVKLLEPNFFSAQFSLLRGKEAITLTARLADLQGGINSSKERFFAESAYTQELQELFVALDVSFTSAHTIMKKVSVEDACVEMSADAGESTESFRPLLESLKNELLLATLTNSNANLAVSISSLENFIEANMSFRFKYAEMYFDEMQFFLQFLFYTLFYSEDLTVVARAVKCVTWIAIFRLDSARASYVANLLITSLIAEKIEFKLGIRLPQLSLDNVLQGKCRVLDVILSLCDYDEDKVTLHHFDDAAQRIFKQPLHHFLLQLAAASEAPILQTTVIHCFGHYVVAVYPRVPLHLAVTLVVDVFRHAKFEIIKAAGAAMLAQIANHFSQIASEHPDNIDMEELKSLKDTGYFLSVYSPKDSNTDNTLHGEIIRTHGASICEILRPFITAVISN